MLAGPMSLSMKIAVPSMTALEPGGALTCLHATACKWLRLLLPSTSPLPRPPQSRSGTWICCPGLVHVCVS